MRKTRAMSREQPIRTNDRQYETENLLKKTSAAKLLLN